MLQMDPRDTCMWHCEFHRHKHIRYVIDSSIVPTRHSRPEHKCKDMVLALGFQGEALVIGGKYRELSF